MGVFHTLNCTNANKSRNAPHIPKYTANKICKAKPGVLNNYRAKTLLKEDKKNRRSSKIFSDV